MNKDERTVTIHLGDGSPIVTQKPDRNAKCRCGSGMKQKKCCGDKTQFYSTKPKRTSPDQSDFIKEATN